MDIAMALVYKTQNMEDVLMTYWKDTLLIGVPEIDDQHKKLVGAIDALMEACAKGQGRVVIGNTLKFVLNYTKEHFAAEEKLQAQYSYPDINAHKRQHTQFIASASALMDDFEENGPNIALVGKINKTLIDWLVNHITAEDKKIGDFIKSKGG